MRRIDDFGRLLESQENKLENIASGQNANLTLRIALIDHYE